MRNKLVVIINSLKVPKMKKILLYETEFLVRNYRCPLSSNEFVEPPRTKFLGTPLTLYILTHTPNQIKGTV